MITTDRFLLARRNDGKFLRLHKTQHTTRFDFVDAPELAERIIPWLKKDFNTPQPAIHYFENSPRARYVWLKDCIMVAYEITTEIKAVLIKEVIE